MMIRSTVFSSLLAIVAMATTSTQANAQADPQMIAQTCVSNIAQAGSMQVQRNHDAGQACAAMITALKANGRPLAAQHVARFCVTRITVTSVHVVHAITFHARRCVHALTALGAQPLAMLVAQAADTSRTAILASRMVAVQGIRAALMAP